MNSKIAAIEQTAELIRMFAKAVEDTKANFADNPVYVQSAVSRAEKQIKKLYCDLFLLLELPDSNSFEESLSSTFVLYGNEGGDAYVTTKSLHGFLNRLRQSFRAYSPNEELNFLVRAASTGSLHLSFEPMGDDKNKGIEALKAIGETARALSNAKNLKKSELNEFQIAVASLMPKDKIGIQRMEMKGNVLSPQPLNISKNEVKIKIARKIRKVQGEQIQIPGKIVDVNLENMSAIMRTSTGGRKRLFFDQSSKNTVIDSLKSDFVVIIAAVDSKKIVIKKIEIMPDSQTS